MALEYCYQCGEPTGRAGAGDDSIYCVYGAGPFCEKCWKSHWLVCEDCQIYGDG